MKEGLLRKVKGKVYPYDDVESYLYGFDNRFGLLIRRALGGPIGTDTLDADKGLYEISPIGIGLKASEIKGISQMFGAQELLEVLSMEEMKEFIYSPDIKGLIEKFDATVGKYKSIAKEDIPKFIQTAKIQKERQATHVVKDPTMNPYYSIEEAAKKYKTKTYKEVDDERYLY